MKKDRIWNLLCYVDFAYQKTQISTSKYTKICFKSMKQKIEWILLIKHTNINKQIYNNMFQINEAKNRMDFAYQTHKYQQANIQKYVSNHMWFLLIKTQISTSKYTKICFKSMKKHRIWNLLC